MAVCASVYTLATVYVLYTAVPLSLPKHQYTVFSAVACDITAAAPLPCHVIDTLMWMMVIEVMGVWERSMLHTIRKVLKRGTEAELQGARSQIRFRLDIGDS